jgi:hypothetical protein
MAALLSQFGESHSGEPFHFHKVLSTAADRPSAAFDIESGLEGRASHGQRCYKKCRHDARSNLALIPSASFQGESAHRP